MSNICFGVVGSDGGFIETSNSERGAKNKATRSGYTAVYKMHRVSWAVQLVATKTGKRWQK